MMAKQEPKCSTKQETLHDTSDPSETSEEDGTKQIKQMDPASAVDQKSGVEKIWTPETIAAEKETVMTKMRCHLSVIRETVQTKDYRNKDFRRALFDVMQSYFRLKKAALKDREAFRLEICEFLMAGDSLDILVTALSDMSAEGLSKRFLTEDGEVDVDLLRPTRVAETIFFNYSDPSMEFARRIARNDMFMNTLLRHQRELQSDHLEGKLNDELTKLLRISVAIPYNTVRHNDSECIERVHELGMVDAVRPLLQSSLEAMKASAVLFTIFVVSEDEARRFCSDPGTIDFLLERLRIALKDPYKRGCGYSNIELLNALEKLSALDVNKRMLESRGALEIMKGILEEGDSDEIPLALSITTQLAFHTENAEWISREMKALIESKFGEHEDDKLRLPIEKLFWILREKASENTNCLHRAGEEIEGRKRSGSKELGLGTSQVPHHRHRHHYHRMEKFAAEDTKKMAVPRGSRPIISRSSDGTGGPPLPTSSSISVAPCDRHVMISYQWESQKTIKQIVAALRADGFKVWFDLNDMGSNTLDSMAEAVENAWAVIIAISRLYKESSSTRMEAEYAHKNSKLFIPLMMEKWRPDGWLGLLVGEKLYYDFSGKYAFDTKITELLKALHSHQKGITEPEVVPLEMGDLMLQPPSAAAEERKYLENWGPDNVRKWCRDNAIDWTGCRSLTGEDLLFLLRVQKEAPEFFYRSIETHLKLSTLPDIARFVKCLERL